MERSIGFYVIEFMLMDGKNLFFIECVIIEVFLLLQLGQIYLCLGDFLIKVGKVSNNLLVICIYVGKLG